MIKADISSEESILHNLDTWCYEVGTRFQIMNNLAARECMTYIDKLQLNKQIVDLGCGDGAATRLFRKFNYNTLGVDINPEKLEKVPGPKIETDILNFVTCFKQLPNVFSHHAFEHMLEIEKIIELIGEKMSPGSLYYVIVPAEDYLHSVHHVVFESPEELLPEGFKPLKLEKQFRDEMEFICIAQKLA